MWLRIYFAPAYLACIILGIVGPIGGARAKFEGLHLERSQWSCFLCNEAATVKSEGNARNRDEVVVSCKDFLAAAPST